MSTGTVKQLCREGAKLLDDGQHNRALDVLTSALKSATTPLEKGAVLYNIAQSQYCLGNDSAALQSIDQALSADTSTHYLVEKATDFPRFRNTADFLALLRKHGIIARRRRPSLVSVLFSEKGRISRRTYWIKGVLAGNAIILCLYFIGLVFSAPLLRLPLFIIGLAIALSPLVKRIQDRNRSPWFVLGLAVPILNIIVAVWLFVEAGFLKGTTGPNNYGVDPLLD